MPAIHEHKAPPYGVPFHAMNQTASRAGLLSTSVVSVAIFVGQIFH